MAGSSRRTVQEHGAPAEAGASGHGARSCGDRAMAEQVTALSMSWRVARAIRQEGWVGEIIAVHPWTWHVTGDDADIYAIVPEPLGNGPLNLVIRASANPAVPLLSVGASVASTGTRLLLGESLDIDLEAAALWDPKAYLARDADPNGLQRCIAELSRSAPVRAPGESLARLLPHLHEEDLPAPLASVGHFPRSHALIAGLFESLVSRNRKSLTVVTSSLAGLGPGVTPAGDDFLAGMLLAIAVLEEQRPDTELSQIGTLLLETAAPRTHEISAAYMRAAHAGEASEPWHPLLGAILAGETEKIRNAVTAVVQAGDTSGADMLAGFIIALAALRGNSPVVWESLAASPRTVPPAETNPPAG